MHHIRATEPKPVPRTAEQVEADLADPDYYVIRGKKRGLGWLK